MARKSSQEERAHFQVASVNKYDEVSPIVLHPCVLSTESGKESHNLCNVISPAFLFWSVYVYTFHCHAMGRQVGAMGIFFLVCPVLLSQQ